MISAILQMFHKQITTSSCSWQIDFFLVSSSDIAWWHSSFSCLPQKLTTPWFRQLLTTELTHRVANLLDALSAAQSSRCIFSSSWATKAELHQKSASEDIADFFSFRDFAANKQKQNKSCRHDIWPNVLWTKTNSATQAREAERATKLESVARLTVS